MDLAAQPGQVHQTGRTPGSATGNVAAEVVQTSPWLTGNRVR